jgi:antitoxin ParD1/3/4
MPTRNVVLTEHQEEMIESLVRSGRYQNASEVLRQGLRLVPLHGNYDSLGWG